MPRQSKSADFPEPRGVHPRSAIAASGLTAPFGRVFTGAGVKAFHEEYHCLAKSRLRLSSLWLGKTHLVYAKGRGFLVPFTEEYRRFRFSEIEAISLAKTSRLALGALYLIALLFCLGSAALIYQFDETIGPMAFSGLILAGLGALGSLLLLARHLILGPTCTCVIQTRHSRERLLPLRRYHRSLETIRQIEEKTRAQQAAMQSPSGGSPAVVPRGERYYQVPVVVTGGFAFFVLFGLTALAGLSMESLLITGLVFLGVVAGSLLISLSLVAVVRNPTPQPIRGMLWVILVLHFLTCSVGIVYYLVVATKEPAYTVGLTGPLECFTAITAEGGMPLTLLFLSFFLGYAFAGGWGLVLARKWIRHTRLARILSRADSGGEADSPESS